MARPRRRLRTAWTAAVLVLVPLLARAEVPGLDASGLEALILDNRGRVVLVDFWTTWCPPCRRQLPELARLWETYREAGLTVAGVSLDARRETVETFLDKREVPYPVYLAALDVRPRYGVMVLPTTLLVAADGRVAARHEGFVSVERLEEEIRRLLVERDAGRVAVSSGYPPGTR